MLILFDVNGVLCFKCHDESKLKISSKDLVNAASYMMILRPGIREVLKRLSQEHTLGIFSSTTFKNVVPVVKELEKSGIKFAITAYREYTQLDPDYLKNVSIQSFDTIKRLETIWSHPFFNSNRQWDSTNTLLVDDSAVKTRFIDPDNVLVIPSFDYVEYVRQDTLENFEQNIWMALTNLRLKHAHVQDSLISSLETPESLAMVPTQSSCPETSQESDQSCQST